MSYSVQHREQLSGWNIGGFKAPRKSTGILDRCGSMPRSQISTRKNRFESDVSDKPVIGRWSMLVQSHAAETANSALVGSKPRRHQWNNDPVDADRVWERLTKANLARIEGASMKTRSTCVEDEDTCSSNDRTTVSSAPLSENTGEAELARMLSRANNRRVSVDWRINLRGYPSVNVSWIDTPHWEGYSALNLEALPAGMQLAQLAQSCVQEALDQRDTTGRFRHRLQDVKMTCSRRKFLLKFLPNETTQCQVRDWVLNVAYNMRIGITSVTMPRGRSKGYATIEIDDPAHLTDMMRACDNKHVRVEGSFLVTVNGDRSRRNGKTTRAVHYYVGDTVKLHIQNVRTDFDLQTVSALVWSMFVPLGAEEVTVLDRENKFKSDENSVYRSCNVRVLASKSHGADFLKSFFNENRSLFQTWLGSQGSTVVLDLKRS